MFDEAIKTQPLERYGNTVYDTKHKTITGFVKDDVLYNQYNFDPVMFAWNMDPKTIPGHNPYEVFGNNPVLYVDPQGDIINFMGYRDPMKAPISNEVAENMWNEMRTYLHSKGLGNLITQLENSDKVYNVYFTTGSKVFGTDLDYNNPFINMNPFQQLVTTNNYIMSPIEGLVHELGHAINYDNDREDYIKKSNTFNAQYDNEEEKRVIEGIEQVAAQRMGTGLENYTRKDHKGTAEYTNRWQPIWDVSDLINDKVANQKTTPKNVASPADDAIVPSAIPKTESKKHVMTVTYE